MPRAMYYGDDIHAIMANPIDDSVRAFHDLPNCGIVVFQDATARFWEGGELLCSVGDPIDESLRVSFGVGGDIVVNAFKMFLGGCRPF